MPIRLLNAALLLLFVAIPVSSLVVVAERMGASPTELEPPAMPEYAFVTQREDDDETGAKVELVLEAGVALQAPAWTGLVQSISPRAGDTIRSGDLFSVVSGVPRIALHTEAPMYRALRVGDRGTDVGQLQSALAGLGYKVDAELGRYGTETRETVRSIMTYLGAPSVREFDPGLIVWLPATEIAIASIELVVGAPAPAAGAAIAKSQPVVASSTIRKSSGQQLAAPGYELKIGTVDIGAIAATGLTQDQRQLVVAMHRSGEISVSGTDDESDEDSESSLTFDATIRLTRPALLAAVPSSAVVGGPSDGQCVLIATADGRFEQFDTSIVGGDFGWNAIDPAPNGETLIVANPLDSKLSDGCAS